MPRTLVTCCVGLCLFCLIASARGDEKADESPEPVVKRAIEAMKADRVEDYVKTLHAGEIKRLRTSIMDAVEVAAKDGKEMPLLRLMKVKSIDDLKKCDDVEFFTILYTNALRL